jgi:hypothetical protein
LLNGQVMGVVALVALEAFFNALWIGVDPMQLVQLPAAGNDFQMYASCRSTNSAWGYTTLATKVGLSLHPLLWFPLSLPFVVLPPAGRSAALRSAAGLASARAAGTVP